MSCYLFPLIKWGACTSLSLALVSNVLWKACSLSLVTCSNWNSFCVLASLTALQASDVSSLSSLLICPCSIQQITTAFCISDLKNRLCFADGGLLRFPYLSFHQHGYLYALPLIPSFFFFFTFKEISRTLSPFFFWESVSTG